MRNWTLLGQLNREIGGLSAFKDTVHIERSSTVHLDVVGAIRDQPSLAAIGKANIVPMPFFIADAITCSR